MFFKQLNEGPCKTYLLVSEHGEAVIVDPVLENVEQYMEEMVRRRVSLRYIVDTHVHADHISGGAAIRDRTGADYVMHELSVSACANRRVRDGDILKAGDVEIRVMYTPGHTQDSITLVLSDRLLTGDFLFIGAGGAGRTDLPGGDPGEHWDSLQKLRSFPDSTLIYPAHDYHGRESSTLGEERRQNPRLKPRTRDDYIEWLESQRLGPADWMAEVIRANYACARDPRAAWIPVDEPSCEVMGTASNVNSEIATTITAEELRDLIARGESPFLLDVRQPEEFTGELGHIAGATLIPVGELARRVNELAGLENKPIVTICRSGGRSATAASILKLAGFSDVRSLAGGMTRWNALALPVEGRRAA